MTIQSIHFNASLYTAQQASSWLTINKKQAKIHSYGGEHHARQIAPFKFVKGWSLKTISLGDGITAKVGELKN